MAARVSSGKAASGTSGPVRLGTGVSTRASGCMAITVDGGVGSDRASPLLSLGAGSIPRFETPDGQGGTGNVFGGRGLSGGMVSVSGGSGAWAAAGRVKLDAGLSDGSQGGDIYVASAPGKSAGHLRLWAAFSRCRGSGGNVQLRGGNSASFAGGLLRTIAGCSAELNVVTNQSRDSGSVKLRLGMSHWKLGTWHCVWTRMLSGGDCGLGRKRARESWRGGSADVHAGKSCLSGGGDIYVRGGAGSISEGGGVCWADRVQPATGGQVHFKRRLGDPSRN